MNDEEIKAQFRAKVEKCKSIPTRVAIPNNQKPRELQSIQKVIEIPVEQPNQPNKFIQFINTKRGSFITLMVFAFILALGQTNSATPFKFVFVRNLAIAYGVHWWRFRNEKRDDDFS